MIICAAIKTTFVNNKNETVTVVIPGLRHGDCFNLIQQINIPLRKDRWDEEQGFINHEGEFLNREEALKYALAIGQLSATVREYKRTHNENELYSEDLY